MIATNQNYDRITFSLPKAVNTALGKLKIESKQSKSKLIKTAIEQYLAQQEKTKLQKAVKIMSNEYKNNSEFIEFSILDSEDFL